MSPKSLKITRKLIIITFIFFSITSFISMAVIASALIVAITFDKPNKTVMVQNNSQVNEKIKPQIYPEKTVISSNNNRVNKVNKNKEAKFIQPENIQENLHLPLANTINTELQSDSSYKTCKTPIKQNYNDIKSFEDAENSGPEMFTLINPLYAKYPNIPTTILSLPFQTGKTLLEAVKMLGYVNRGEEIPEEVLNNYEKQKEQLIVKANNLSNLYFKSDIMQNYLKDLNQDRVQPDNDYNQRIKIREIQLLQAYNDLKKIKTQDKYLFKMIIIQQRMAKSLLETAATFESIEKSGILSKKALSEFESACDDFMLIKQDIETIARK